MNIELDARELARMIPHIAGEAQLISLRMDGNGQTIPVLAREVQRHPIRGDILHVDFYAVAMDRPILVGESQPVERGEGVLLHPLTHVEIECLPRDLVPAIEVDISRLTQVDDAIYVKDLMSPPGITILTDPDELVVRVNPVAAEEVIEEAAPAAAAEPEIIAKGKAAAEEEEEEE
ncbi:MAG: 50S ribosomal protein L25 [Chloroflexota bacterium]